VEYTKEGRSDETLESQRSVDGHGRFVGQVIKEFSDRCGNRDLLGLEEEMDVGEGNYKRVDWRLTLIGHRILFVQNPGIVERGEPSRVWKR